jgi:non-ribosomal peptide synthetase component F
MSQLRLLGRREGATLYMTLLAAFQCLLYRYSGQTDILVGTPNANRSRVELEGLIGFFMNTLVIRGDLGGDPTFREILSRVRERTLEAYGHQDLPFEALVAELQPERTANYNPLFRVWFAWLDEQLSELQLSNLAVRGFEVEDHSSRFDVVLSFTNTDCQLNGSFRYNTDIFDEDTIEEMIERFLSLLRSVTLDSGLKLLDIPLE